MKAPARWQVDADESSVVFSAHGFWGLTRTTGSFAALAGTAVVNRRGLLSGELVIPTRTLSTGLALRDRHLRGPAFFDVERYPEIRFTVHRLIASREGHVIRGELSVRDRSVDLELPVELVERPGHRLALTTEAILERAPLGLGHSTLGMIRGPAEVWVRLALKPDWR